MDPTASDYDAKNADLHPIARLAEGHGVAPAQSMVTATVKGWVDRLPPGAFGTAERRVAYRARIDAAVIPLSRRASADSRRLVWSLFCFALVVLAIAAGHVANVQFARGIRRSREFGIRYQLGASRRRLVALVLGESAVFALLAALGGVAVIAISSAFTRSHLPVQVAAESPVLRGMTLFAILATACVVALVLGVAGGVLGVESRAMHSPGS